MRMTILVRCRNMREKKHDYNLMRINQFSKLLVPERRPMRTKDEARTTDKVKNRRRQVHAKSELIFRVAKPYWQRWNRAKKLMYVRHTFKHYGLPTEIVDQMDDNCRIDNTREKEGQPPARYNDDTSDSDCSSRASESEDEPDVEVTTIASRDPKTGRCVPPLVTIRDQRDRIIVEPVPVEVRPQGTQTKPTMEMDALVKEANDARMKKLADTMCCPVCMDVPRPQTIIITCRNGHALDQDCRQHPGDPCVTCRDPIMTRNQFAERLIQVALADYIVNCKFTTSGCGHSNVLGTIALHEEVCPYRDLRCPVGQQMELCDWTGPAAGFPKHLRRSACMQVCRSEDLFFESYVCDYVGQNSTVSVFAKDEITQWTPTLFVSKRALPFIVYMTLHRAPAGVWMAIFRTASPKHITNSIRVQAEFYGANATTRDSAPTFSYVGPVAHHSHSHSQALDMGRVATALDPVILRMKYTPQRRLFHYRVQFHFNWKDTVERPFLSSADNTNQKGLKLLDDTVDEMIKLQEERAVEMEKQKKLRQEEIRLQVAEEEENRVRAEQRAENRVRAERQARLQRELQRGLHDPTTPIPTTRSGTLDVRIDAINVGDVPINVEEEVRRIDEATTAAVENARNIALREDREVALMEHTAGEALASREEEAMESSPPNLSAGTGPAGPELPRVSALEVPPTVPPRSALLLPLVRTMIGARQENSAARFLDVAANDRSIIRAMNFARDSTEAGQVGEAAHAVSREAYLEQPNRSLFRRRVLRVFIMWVHDHPNLTMTEAHAALAELNEICRLANGEPVPFPASTTTEDRENIPPSGPSTMTEDPSGPSTMTEDRENIPPSGPLVETAPPGEVAAAQGTTPPNSSTEGAGATQTTATQEGAPRPPLEPLTAVGTIPPGTSSTPTNPFGIDYGLLACQRDIVYNNTVADRALDRLTERVGELPEGSFHGRPDGDEVGDLLQLAEATQTRGNDGQSTSRPGRESQELAGALIEGSRVGLGPNPDGREFEEDSQDYEESEDEESENENYT